jgi:hypothetical protein
MAWEDRNGRSYYYRKRREGRRVASEYVGTGLAGEIAEIFDGEDRRETEHKRRELRKQKASAQAIDSQVSQVDKYTRAITQACLLLAGYHPHKGQWRKLRNV